MAKDKKIRLPACICAWSPCTNLAENLPSRKKNVKTDLVVPFENLNDLLREVYLDGKTDPRNPYVSPLFGDYQSFPPLKITADSGEVLFDDSELLVKKAKTAGVEVEYQVFSGTFHSFPTIGRSCPESKQILKETAAYIHKHCDA
jgi:acetyl esterase/lipase